MQVSLNKFDEFVSIFVDSFIVDLEKVIDLVELLLSFVASGIRCGDFTIRGNRKGSFIKLVILSTPCGHGLHGLVPKDVEVRPRQVHLLFEHV